MSHFLKGMGTMLSRRHSLPPQPTNRERVRGRSHTQRHQTLQQSAHTQPVTERPLREKYAFIPDQYETVDQVTAALRASGLESSNLIVGIDFTKSNEWTGRHSFNGRSLHEIGSVMNPYEQAISIIGRTLSPFDEDNLIPCFGFGDATTHDVNVFSFYENNRPCHGFEQVLERYKQIVPHLQLAGPTSFAPVIEASMGIVEASGGQYHVLVIIADGQFVNFTSIMSKNLPQSAKEAAFALAALMEIPIQYKATIEFNILGRRVGSVPNILPRNPPLPTIQHDAVPSSFPNSATFQSTASHSISSTENSPAGMSSERESQACPVCLTNSRDMVFGCGHMACRDCSPRLSNCPICRARISTRLRVYLS